MSPTLANRYAKFFPHAVLPEADCSIYLDANTLVLGGSDAARSRSSSPPAPTSASSRTASARASPRSSSSAGRWARSRPPTWRRAWPSSRRYRDEGLPADPPFTENAIIFRRHGSPALAAAMDLWWSELQAYTQRDQLSLPYVLFKSRLAVKLWDWNYKYQNPYFMRYLHRRGPLSDLNVFLKNKRHYGRLQQALYGAALFLSHGGRGYRSQHRRG